MAHPFVAELYSKKYFGLKSALEIKFDSSILQKHVWPMPPFKPTFSRANHDMRLETVLEYVPAKKGNWLELWLKDGK